MRAIIVVLALSLTLFAFGEDVAGVHVIPFGPTTATPVDPDGSNRAAAAGTHPLIHPTVYLLRHWAEAIRSGATQSPSFEDGFKVQEVLDAIGRSVLTRRSVEMQRGRRGPTTP